ncbi:uncharacterized protein FIBRA_02521 [Fibroporia radiculosa]|uniref:Uncharacterized protein n=1 Tax=Fibroporia radiculosa TaxID=599839 RepID=J4HV27_9APHY|nr:uncharacterized protein FIBRA_02521 [Fibroporia radiculosa]CCM00487.1 predicted protein [Fibroporia radiculosa]
MTRQLRSRVSRPNYAALLQFDEPEDAGAGPSNAPAPVAEEGDSGSDFEPDQQGQDENEDIPLDATEEEDEDFANQESERELSIAAVAAPETRRKAQRTAQTRKTRTVPLISEPSSLSTQQPSVFPSLHHRHRAVPIYRRDAPVERLVKRPVPFSSPSTVPTNSWSYEPIVDILNKSWGFNVGPGPLWELMEDRGWYKESMSSGGEETAAERNRRPRVFETIRVQELEVITAQEASSYLPTDVTTTEEGALKLPSPIPCSFGPFGKQKRVDLKMFETLKLADLFPESKSHVFNPGAPVWGIDWCPIHVDDRSSHSHKQYLAVSPFPTRSYAPTIGKRAHRPAYSCIQIWSLKPSLDAMHIDGDEDKHRSHGPEATIDAGEMQCEMVLCVDCGPAFELKWCPLPSNDFHETRNHKDKFSSPKLGILAGTFEDGSLSLFAVPDPASLTPKDDDTSPPTFVKVEPLLRIELEDTLCWAIDWANSELIAVGCTNGQHSV